MWRGVGLAVPLKKIGVPRQLFSRNKCFRVMCGGSCSYPPSNLYYVVTSLRCTYQPMVRDEAHTKILFRCRLTQLPVYTTQN